MFTKRSKELKPESLFQTNPVTLYSDSTSYGQDSDTEFTGSKKNERDNMETVMVLERITKDHV